MKIRFGKILENAARLAGRQVDVMPVPDGWCALAALAVSDGIRRIAAEKFPMMQRVEYRRYRPTWTSNAGWTKGQECWYGESYWRLISEASSGAPGSDPCWKKLNAEEVIAFIAWEQPWERTIIDRGATDVNRFAYLSDPRQNPNASQLKVVGMTDLGVTIQSPAPTGVYVKFVPQFPNVSYVAWNGSSAYDAGEVVYYSTTKDCYQCLSSVAAPTSGSSLNPAPSVDTVHWDPIRISDIFEGFLTRLAAVDMMTEAQGKFQTRADADREFEGLCERYHDGCGESRVRTGRFI